jgi:hypothetical protein
VRLLEEDGTTEIEPTVVLTPENDGSGSYRGAFSRLIDLSTYDWIYVEIIIDGGSDELYTRLLCPRQVKVQSC